MNQFARQKTLSLVLAFSLFTSPVSAWTDNSIVQESNVPDIIAADKLGQTIESELLQRFRGSTNPNLTIQLVHTGDITDFPSELNWVVDHIKRAEARPGFVPKVGVELFLVEDEEFQSYVAEAERWYAEAEEISKKVGYQIADSVNRLAEHLQVMDEACESLEHIIEKLNHQANEIYDGQPLHSLLQRMANESKSLMDFISRHERSLVKETDWQKIYEIQGSFEKLLREMTQFSEVAKQNEAFAVLNPYTKESIEILSSIEDQLAIVVQVKSDVAAQIYQISYEKSDVEAYAQSQLAKPRVQLRQYFGLPDGMSWVMYKLSFTDRTAREHITEFSSGALQALAIYFINYSILAEKILENPDAVLNPVAAAMTAAGWKLLTGYIERANNAFFAQGNNWGPIHEFSMNNKFFLSAAYVHSIIIGLTVQLAARGWAGVDEDIVLHTAWNSFLGLFAKAVPLMLISKHQIKKEEIEDSESLHHSKWKTIAFNFIFGVTYQAIKAVHFYQFDFLNISTVFVVLGLGGLSYELFKFVREGRNQVATKSGKMTRFGYTWKRFKNRLQFIGRRSPPLTCRTLLTVPRDTEERGL